MIICSVKHRKDAQNYISISCNTKMGIDEKMNLNDCSTIDEHTQNQTIEIRTNGIRMCPNAYCLRQPSGFVRFFLLFF